MKPYTFFKHDGGSTPPVFDLGEFDDDAAARTYALRLLVDGPDYTAIEVWDGTGEPFRIDRQSDGE